MTDIKSTEERSKNMSAIRSKNTKPEQFIRHELFIRGYRYRNNVKNVFGHPDLWMAKYRTAIFVNGCFWHRHAGCRFAYMPKSRVDFWRDKFDKNLKRDQRVYDQLLSQNIKVLIIWECTIKKMKRETSIYDETVIKILKFIHNDNLFVEI